MKKRVINGFGVIALLLLIGCGGSSEGEQTTDGQPQASHTLPIMGQKEFIEGVDEDTLYHTIPYWSFTNQDGEVVSKSDYQGSIYVADYFFTHCPVVCPMLTKNMKYLQSKTSDLDIKLISHTVDPHNDNPDRLKWYCRKHEIDNSNWNLVTGEKMDLYELGVNGYLVPNQEDATAPGGFLHSEKFILIDKEGRIRGMYNGTEMEEVDQLVEDIKKLRKEYE